MIAAAPVSDGGLRFKNEDPSAASGFTLIELLFVVLVLSVVVGMAAPAFVASHRRLSHESAARHIVQFLSYARERAVMERAPLRVAFDPGGGKYRLLRFSGASGNYEPVPERWGRTQSVPEGATLRAEPDSVVFLPDGTASAAISVELSVPGNAPLRLSVDPVLGRAGLEEEHEEK